MNAKQADALAQQVSLHIQGGQIDTGYTLLAPVISNKIPFRYLDRIGKVLGAQPFAQTKPLLQQLASSQTIGAWPIIGMALAGRLEDDLAGVLALTHLFIIEGDTWHSTDSTGERVVGPALVENFDQTITLLTPWREDENRWVRRSLGVATHLWTKRAKGNPELSARAASLLDLLSPLFEEKEMDAVKGIGWGLKTLGRYYPELAAPWLLEQVVHQQRPYRATMLRKALTYLPEEARQHIKPA
ncbi:MAG: hypothetical protein DWQ07_20180 [Chloroflexi bacterium]|nr:MAG: hypothetical protein DWQ07_20180 [Chloroflexota bacterium]MBL1194400.1 hypothetical protein [Chloroflexota bacterium]NOH11688.1 hypothetical protein [Chloroflexota bacterium]